MVGLALFIDAAFSVVFLTVALVACLKTVAIVRLVATGLAFLMVFLAALRVTGLVVFLAVNPFQQFVWLFPVFIFPFLEAIFSNPAFCSFHALFVLPVQRYRFIATLCFKLLM